ncbi:MAG: hypothetical protein B7Z60_03115 [Ferrovum sp. 37-45-19]|jgi:secreted PhoX family phosphatase|uniref:hypothetical protein n=1 Tax=Ferrovum sp. JA12 TaxID=1356299 RepID=UPI000703C04B|nr:hypothetical protein [Ferrovum sp. JA12]OYV80488.1 MAG: hypothetical protein B7Z65_01185 [Ferrovum sp. 21-44-67]OYV94803.1 MAG: hypothetical protein B7Z60_03115 [Ferrovum sp. 37-45-19]OZB34164.1 MAG: hypothetical protein B7X47_02060 [Ferrovum sp. 34-44-207]HQT81071.1 hypothetical protein [Ferrovaceae bacterium]KRH79204.1 high-potential iron-sulfur protein [Ferrovum sp. JA12]
MEDIKLSRRQLLKMGSIALVAAPLVGLSTSASAHQNTAVRAALKFQTKPNGAKHCAVCMNFLPKADLNHSGCKLYPGDDEICQNCYCNGFVQKAG